MFSCEFCEISNNIFLVLTLKKKRWAGKIFRHLLRAREPRCLLARLYSLRRQKLTTISITKVWSDLKIKLRRISTHKLQIQFFTERYDAPSRSQKKKKLTKISGRKLRSDHYLRPNSKSSICQNFKPCYMANSPRRDDIY